MSSKVSFKVESLRRIPCPMGRDKHPEKPQSTFIAICNVQNLPKDIPMDTNPREQNLKTKVAKKIENSLVYGYDSIFHLLNRGLVISAETVKFNNDSNLLTLTFTDTEKHGDVDGGHTYKTILANRNKIDFPQYVRLEIMTGVEEFFEELAGARNTSVQVQDKSLAELEGHFDIIKESLEHEPFAEHIAFKENAEGEIDITEIVAILTMFNIDRYSDSNHPVLAYSSKKKCVDNYLLDIKKPGNAFNKLKYIAPDIFRLYTHIEEKMPQVYIDKEGNGGGKYGRIKGVVYKDGKPFHKLPFGDGIKCIPYESPKGFIYPILSAFRVLVTDGEDGYYQWSEKTDPIQYFDALAPELVMSTIERSRTLGNNPQSVGKDTGHWAQMYKTVKTKHLEEMLMALRK